MAVLVRREYPFLNAITEEIQERVEAIGRSFIERIKNEDELRLLVFDQDFQKRDSLHLMSAYNITALLNNRNMEKIALELWTSEYDVASSFMECSSAYKMLVDSQFDKLKDPEIKNRFYNTGVRVVENYGHHMFQFKVWKRSMQAKFVVEGLFLFLITVTFQYFLMAAMD